MASDEKTYSFISVEKDTAEEEAGVRTRREVIDGEETIIVSSNERSAGSHDEGSAPLAARQQAARSNEPSRPLPTKHDASDNRGGTAGSLASDNAEDDADDVPFRHMQSIIIICLIVLIVAFLVYFNFFR